MLRTLSRKLSFRSHDEREFTSRPRAESPEFVSRDAARHDRAQAALLRSENFCGLAGPSYAEQERRGSLGLAPSLRPFSFEARAEDSFYLGSSLEALSLEAIIQPALGPMREVVRENNLLPGDTLPSRAEVRAWLAEPPRAARKEPHAGAKAALPKEPVRVRTPTPSIVVTPPAEERGSSSSEEENVFERAFGAPSEHKKKDPFALDEELLDTVPPMTPLPRRPLLRRNAVSYRTSRELPLRVQATRRAHQAAFAAVVNQRSQNNFRIERRTSLPDIALRERQTGRPTRPTLQRQHSSSFGGDAYSARPRVTLPTPGPVPTAPLPDLPTRIPRRPPDPRDYYLEAAMKDWSFTP